MKCHFRPLSRTIGREDSEASDIHPVKMMIGIAEEFTGPFGRPVRRDGLNVEVLFGERDSLIFSIDRGGGGKDEILNSVFSTGFQKNNRPANVYILVKKRIGNRGSHPSPGSEVNNEVNLVLLEDPIKVLGISNISSDQFEQLWKFLGRLLHIPNFYLGIVKAVEVVEANDTHPIAQKSFTKM